jgi:hypothetical protein
MAEIEAAAIVDADVVGDNLILIRHDGTQINAGSVRGPAGPTGPVGTDKPALSAIPVLDVGISGQIRAGRQLTAADFTNMGLSAPAGLWNLSDLTDASGNGRNLLNKGGVAFSSGINGLANTAAQFAGSTAQALYISDTGVNDPFRLRAGTMGCWMRSAKKGTYEVLIGKWVTANQSAYYLGTRGDNTAAIYISLDGGSAGASYAACIGFTDVHDDRWHFLVGVIEGASCKIYVDGVLEQTQVIGPVFQGSAPFNIGAAGADAAVAASTSHFGRIDEVFITPEVLSEDQIRNLYAVRIPHTLAAVPSRATINVRRRRRGAALVAGDFPTQPLRLHNFSGGSLGDEGSGNVPLTNNGGAVPVAGADGAAGNAFNFIATSSQNLSSSDAGLPAALTPRSYGLWFKTNAASVGILGWGTVNTADIRAYITSAGTLATYNGAEVMVTSGPMNDGQWHHLVNVEDNTAIDGAKRKLYIDGRLVNISAVMNSITLGGAFRIGSYANATGFFIGHIDGVFVCNYALTPEQVISLYSKTVQALTPSPKNPGDHIEGMTSTDLFAIFDTLETGHRVDLAVAP